MKTVIFTLILSFGILSQAHADWNQPVQPAAWQPDSQSAVLQDVEVLNAECAKQFPALNFVLTNPSVNPEEILPYTKGIVSDQNESNFRECLRDTWSYVQALEDRVFKRLVRARISMIVNRGLNVTAIRRKQRLGLTLPITLQVDPDVGAALVLISGSRQ